MTNYDIIIVGGGAVSSELQSKIQSKREELGLREKLSELTNSMRKDQSDTAAAAKLAAAAMKPQGGNRNGER